MYQHKPNNNSIFSFIVWLLISEYWIHFVQAVRKYKFDSENKMMMTFYVSSRFALKIISAQTNDEPCSVALAQKICIQIQSKNFHFLCNLDEISPFIFDVISCGLFHGSNLRLVLVMIHPLYKYKISFHHFLYCGYNTYIIMVGVLSLVDVYRRYWHSLDLGTL